MKKDEIARIMKLVKEGKLSPEDAADLIEAFEESPDGPASPPPPPPPSAPGAEETRPRDPLTGFLESIERIGKDITTKVNWPEVTDQLKQGVTKGGEALKKAIEDANLGKVTFGFLGATESKTVALPFAITGDQTLRVENLHGEVRIVGGSETNELIAKATIRGNDSFDARAKADEYIPVIEAGDSFVLIKQPDLPGISVDLEVRVSQPVAIEVKSAAGDVSLIKTGRSARVEGASGDVHCIGLEGNVTVRTSSGDVNLVDVRGDNIVVENKSGSLKFADVHGSMNLRTASGDILLERCGGRTVSVEAISGDVVIDLMQPVRGAVNVRTVQGDTVLTLPDGNDCRVSLSTLRGSIDCLLDLQDIQRFDRRVTGQMGDGSGTLDVSAVTGDVRVRQRIHS